MAGIDGIEAFPVDVQLPPQNGRSFARITVSVHDVLLTREVKGYLQPVMTSTGPVKLLLRGALPCVNSSPGAMGCLFSSAKVRISGS